MKASLEAQGMDFLEKKWCDEGEDASGGNKIIVTMEEERRVRKEQQKRKR